ncbi:unnamed protein product, partial [Ectocarpus fasciculatus]
SQPQPREFLLLAAPKQRLPVGVRGNRGCLPERPAAMSNNDVLSWKRGWIPSAIAASLLFLPLESVGLEVFEPGWARGIAAFVALEVVRVGAVGLLPYWWRDIARRTGPLTDRSREQFGGQLTSLLLSSYLTWSIIRWDWQLTNKLPFIQTVGEDHTGVVFNLMAIMLSYIVHDTWHLVRSWRVNRNRVMLIHHFVFAVISIMGMRFRQLPIHMRIHFIMFSAEMSTPLLNGRWLMRHIGLVHKSHVIMIATSFSFLVLFLVTRIMLYLFMILDIIQLYAELIMPMPLRSVFLGAVVVSYVVNLYWAWLIVGALFFGNEGKRRGGPTLTVNHPDTQKSKDT